MNIVNSLDLLNGLNINPVPLEVSQSMTTTKWLMAMQAKINEVILIRNEVLNEAESYANDKADVLQKNINELKALFNNGHTILDGSIGLEKLKYDFKDMVRSLVVDEVHEVAQTVSFGIDDKGYFYALIPQSWNEITFSTDVNGHLILEY